MRAWLYITFCCSTFFLCCFCITPFHDPDFATPRWPILFLFGVNPWVWPWLQHPGVRDLMGRPRGVQRIGVMHNGWGQNGYFTGFTSKTCPAGSNCMRAFGGTKKTWQTGSISQHLSTCLEFSIFTFLLINRNNLIHPHYERRLMLYNLSMTLIQDSWMVYSSPIIIIFSLFQLQPSVT